MPQFASMNSKVVFDFVGSVYAAREKEESMIGRLLRYFMIFYL